MTNGGSTWFAGVYVGLFLIGIVVALAGTMLVWWRGSGRSVAASRLGAYAMGLSLVTVGVAVVGFASGGREQASAARTVGPTPGSGEESATQAESPAASATATARDRTPSSAPTSIGTVAPEELDTFLAAFVTAFREGDADFLLDRLHPEVIELFGEEQCRRWVETFADPTFDIVPSEITGPEGWTWVVDGVSTPIEDAFTVTADFTRQGETAEQVSHFALVGGVQHFFSDCGDPL